MELVRRKVVSRWLDTITHINCVLSLKMYSLEESCTPPEITWHYVDNILVITPRHLDTTALLNISSKFTM